MRPCEERGGATLARLLGRPDARRRPGHRRCCPPPRDPGLSLGTQPRHHPHHQVGPAQSGTAIGTLLRNTTAAVGATLIWGFAIEGVLPLVTGNPNLADWMPGNAAQQILTPQTGGLTPAVAGAVLLGTIAILMTLATTADTRRDP